MVFRLRGPYPGKTSQTAIKMEHKYAAHGDQFDDTVENYMVLKFLMRRFLSRMVMLESLVKDTSAREHHHALFDD